MRNGFLTDPDLALRWVSPRVYDYESDGISGDFPHFWAGSGIPVFSERAINILKEVIACSGDILLLDSEKKTAEKYLAGFKSILNCEIRRVGAGKAAL